MTRFCSWIVCLAVVATVGGCGDDDASGGTDSDEVTDTLSADTVSDTAEPDGAEPDGAEPDTAPPDDVMDISADSAGNDTGVASGDEVALAAAYLVGGAVSSRPGYTLYVFDGDLATPGESSCVQACAVGWPPLVVLDGLASGVADLSSIERTGGQRQVTHLGRPLYFHLVDSAPGERNGESAPGWQPVAVSSGPVGPVGDAIVPLFNETTALEPVASFVRDDGVVVTRVGDRGRDRHAKEDGANSRYDHYLAHYWEYRTARIQLEDFVPNGQSLIRATFITEALLGAREFRLWYWGQTTAGQFHFNPQKEEEKVSPLESGVVYVGRGTWDDDFNKVSDSGNQHKYTLDIVNQWKNGGAQQPALSVGTPMEFEVSQFLQSPPAGTRLNYYGTSFVYVIGEPGLAPFEWDRGVNKPGGSNDGTPIAEPYLSGGQTTLGYNYSGEPAGRFMQMATNLSPGNAQTFVRGRRVHHTSFVDGSHDERPDNPTWSAQANKAGPHYVNNGCATCHVRNGRALVADLGEPLDKWVFKVGDASGGAHPSWGAVLQPRGLGAGTGEPSVSLGSWSDVDGLRAPNYVFEGGTPATYSARIAPQLVGLGLLEAIPEADILALEDPDDADGDGISGRAARVLDPATGEMRLGRFGYKAATFSVQHQVASAFNTDIGVMTELLPAPDCGADQSDCGGIGAELAQGHVDDLVAYVSLLGVPARRRLADATGEALFGSIGCASCHVPTAVTSAHAPHAELRSQAIRPYTDLLLHDMGSGLADTLGEGTATGAEWRTAPLWGLGHSRAVMLGDAKANDLVSAAGQPGDVNRIGYLHDGRARTIDEAIRWHGGEALASQQAYIALSDSDRAALLAFLESL